MKIIRLLNYTLLWQLTTAILAIFSSNSLASDVIQLTTSEREPYVAQNLPEQGYVAELVKRAYQTVDQKVKISFYPQARAQHYAKTGFSDGFTPAYLDSALKKDYVFSDPFPGDYIGLLKKKSRFSDYRIQSQKNVQENLRQLTDYRFGIVLGANELGDFDESYNLFKVVHDRQNVVMLGKDRIDFAVIDKYTAADIMVTKFPHLIGKLEFIDPPLWEHEFRVAFSKNAPNYKQKLSAFNSGLSNLRREDKIKEIASKHGLFPPKKASVGKTKIRIATVNNNDMIVMQRLSRIFEENNPTIELEWRVLEENTLRKRLLADLAISAGEFDVLTIGSFEAPIWAKKGWILPLKALPENYHVEDILDPIRASLSYQDNLYALPFYGESTMTFYRKDLFAAAGLTMPKQPSYEDIQRFAARLHAPDEQVYGICLRGKAGWGANMAYFDTLVNTFGGRWFNTNWEATIDSPEWRRALSVYKNLATNFGPPTIARNNFNENLHLFANGKCAMWIDATVAASMLFNPKVSKVHQYVGFAPAPIGTTQKGSHWLWAWSLAIPSSSKVNQEAQKFITWATS